MFQCCLIRKCFSIWDLTHTFPIIISMSNTTLHPSSNTYQSCPYHLALFVFHVFFLHIVKLQCNLVFPLRFMSLGMGPDRLHGLGQFYKKQNKKKQTNKQKNKTKNKTKKTKKKYKIEGLLDKLISSRLKIG